MTDMGAPRQIEMRLVIGEEPRMPRERRLPVVRLPSSRGECRGEGVCPKLSCRYNLTLDVTMGGGITLNAERPGGRQALRLRNKDSDRFVRGRNALGGDAVVEQFTAEVVARMEALASNCALDLAEGGAHTLDEVAEILGLGSREAVRIIEERALRKLKVRGVALREFLEP